MLNYTEQQIADLLDAVPAKYVKPVGGIPASDLAEVYVKTSQLSSYATTAYVDNAISTAIGDAIGGAY